MKNDPYCYFQGNLVKEEEVGLPLQSLGVTRGFGVFDFFRMRNGKFNFLEGHLDRFDRSQAFMDLSHRIPREEILEAIDTLTKKNRFKHAAFKLVLFGDGVDDDEVLRPFFYITHKDLTHYMPRPSTNLIVHEYVREYPEIKSVNYLTSHLLHRRRVQANAADILFHKNGSVSEGARSSIFIIKDGMLKTPAENILGSITRDQVLRLGKDLLPTRETGVLLDEVLTADEVFICGTLKEVMPVLTIEGRTIGNGRIGSYTKKIQSAFKSVL